MNVAVVVIAVIVTVCVLAWAAAEQAIRWIETVGEPVDRVEITRTDGTIEVYQSTPTP